MKRLSIAAAAFVSSILTPANPAAEPPAFTSGRGVAPGWIEISYSHPGGFETVYLEQRGSGMVQTSAHLQDTFVVKNLAPSTSYDFRLCALYSNGSRDCTEFVPVRTLDAPADAPQAPRLPPQVSGASTSGDSVSIGWSARNGTYSRFLVRLEDQLGNVDQREIAASDHGSFTFPGMRHGATYYLQMKGCRSTFFGAGGLSCGPWSQRVETRVAGAPPPTHAQSISLRNGGNLCLDVHQGTMLSNGGKVQVWECNGQDQQRWAAVEGTLRNIGGLCLDVHAPDMRSNGARVQVWECNGTVQQQWKVSDGKITGPFGRCLDVHAPDMRRNGAKVQLWDCNGSAQQSWRTFP